MDKDMNAARAALAALPRCGATSRQTGAPCKNPGMGNGGRCRFHGGRAGRKRTHGKFSAASRKIVERLYFFAWLLRALHKEAGLPVPDGTLFRPRMTAAKAWRILEEIREERVNLRKNQLLHRRMRSD